MFSDSVYDLPREKVRAEWGWFPFKWLGMMIAMPTETGFARGVAPEMVSLVGDLGDGDNGMMSPEAADRHRLRWDALQSVYGLTGRCLWRVFFLTKDWGPFKSNTIALVKDYGRPDSGTECISFLVSAEERDRLLQELEA